MGLLNGKLSRQDLRVEKEKENRVKMIRGILRRESVGGHAISAVGARSLRKDKKEKNKKKAKRRKEGIDLKQSQPSTKRHEHGGKQTCCRSVSSLRPGLRRSDCTSYNHMTAG